MRWASEPRPQQPSRKKSPMTDRTIFHETGSERLHPDALIARDDMNHETLFVRSLLDGRAIVRVGADGYRVLIQKKPGTDGWGLPHTTAFNTRGLTFASQLPEAALSAFAYFDEPLSSHAVAELERGCADLPQLPGQARAVLRCSPGLPPSEAGWISERWTAQARAAIRGY